MNNQSVSAEVSRKPMLLSAQQYCWLISSSGSSGNNSSSFNCLFESGGKNSRCICVLLYFSRVGCNISSRIACIKSTFFFFFFLLRTIISGVGGDRKRRYPTVIKRSIISSCRSQVTERRTDVTTIAQRYKMLLVSLNCTLYVYKCATTIAIFLWRFFFSPIKTNKQKQIKYALHIYIQKKQE